MASIVGEKIGGSNNYLRDPALPQFLHCLFDSYEQPLKRLFNTVNDEKQRVSKGGSKSRNVLIAQEKTSKLLGINVDDDPGWRNHVYEKED